MNSSDDMPAAIAGLAWTADGLEVPRGDPAALALYPTVHIVGPGGDRHGETASREGLPTDDQLRWALGIGAIAVAAGRRGEDPDGAEVLQRVAPFRAGGRGARPETSGGCYLARLATTLMAIAMMTTPKT